jgi:hypothetical protein
VLKTSSDLHPGNILIRVPGMESWTVDQVRHYLGEPSRVSVSVLREINADLSSPIPGTHQPEYFVRTPMLSEAMMSLCCQESSSITIT